MALEVGQSGAAALQVGHVHVKGLETGLGKGVGHFHMGVDALLAQHGHLGAGSQNRRSYIFDSIID